VYDKYLVREGPRWFPFWDDSWGEGPNAREMYDVLYSMLTSAWGWRDALDPIIIALYTLYAPVKCWFGRNLPLYIHGESQSGKSALAEGWFGGSRAGSTGMVPGANYTRSTSLAGIYQEYKDRTQILILDEIGDQTNRHSRQVMEAMRNLEANDNTIVRGTPSGKTIKYKLDMPLVWASIATPHLEQDANRIIEIHTKRDMKRADAWKVINNKYSEEELAMYKSSVAHCLLIDREEVKAATDRAMSRLDGLGRVPYRRAMIMRPLLGIAEHIGLDVDYILELVAQRHDEMQEELSIAADRDENLRDALLRFEIPYQNGGGMTTTLAEVIHTKQDFENFTLGVQYKAKDDIVALIPTAIQRQVNEQTGMYLKGYGLGKLLKNMMSFIEIRTVRFSCSPRRAYCLKGSVLLNGRLDPSEGELLAEAAKKLLP
jgi:hypothetical protein